MCFLRHVLQRLIFKSITFNTLFIDRDNKSNKNLQSEEVILAIRKYLSFLPQFLKLILGLLKDSRVPMEDKAILVAALAYLLNPADFVPDMIPFAGLVDDLYLVALALLRLLNHVDEEILRQHWPGEEDIVPLLKKLVSLGARLLPRRVREAVIGKVEERGAA